MSPFARLVNAYGEGAPSEDTAGTQAGRVAILSISECPDGEHSPILLD